MKLLFDLQGIQNHSRERGIGRYVLNLFKAVAARDDVEVYALLNGALSGNLEEARAIASAAVGEDNILVFPGMPATMPHNEPLKQRRELCEAAYEAFIENAGCDAFLAGTLVEGFNDETIVSIRRSSTCPVTAVILYDLIPLIDPDKYLGFHLARDWYFDRMDQLLEADLLLAISESSRQEGIKHLGFTVEQCINVGSAINPDVFCPGPPATAKELRALNITKPFLMHTSAFDERKNFEGLIEAFSLLPAAHRAQYQLVLVGGSDGEAAARIRRHAARHGLNEQDVILPGFISDPQLAALYRSCSLFVFPSFHEGFGLPALEAMSCGCPTIGSNVTSVPEVIGLDDLLFDPRDSVAMAELINEILTDEKRRTSAVRHARTHARTFSWDKVAARVVMSLKASCAKKGKKAFVYPNAKKMLADIASRIDLSRFAPGDLLEFGSALVDSERRIIETAGRKGSEEGAIWRIEGPFDSTYSLALLNRETARALADLGYEIALKSTEGPGDFDPSPDFLVANPDLAAMHVRSKRSTHHDAVVVSRNLYPPRVEDMCGPINALHHFAWEESGFPSAWTDNFNNHLTMLTCLSTHVEKIMIDNGVTVPLVTSGCGVDHWERIQPDPTYKVDAKSFKFLHVSSCFPRKGIDSLIEAYGRAFTCNDDVSLIIKTFENPHNELRRLLDEAKARNPLFPDVVTIFGDISDAQLKALYAHCDVMVGPSLAEGYGLPFAEAMLSGIPVITTGWGGQTDFCNEGNSWLVDYRFERTDTHFGLWASAWARVDSDSLVAAMKDARSSSLEQRRAMAAMGRAQLLHEHKWSDVATRLSAAKSMLPAMSGKKEPRIGWISTWNERCGIATYSEHLIGAMDADVVVFGPENYVAVDVQDTAQRLWTRTKSSSNLSRVLDSPLAEDVDVFVVQFNNTFFDHNDLTNFILAARHRNKRIVVSLHSTKDQIETTPPEDYHLSHMVAAFAVCDRLLVHSIEDLNRLKSLGLVDNVVLFPHGTLIQATTPPLSINKKRVPMVATYGFALPHKGLLEVMDAIRILKERSYPVRLRMVNSEYPADISTTLVNKLSPTAKRQGTFDLMEFHNGFLKDEESLQLLSEADLVIFAYQETAESASGAVRYGMAVGLPVAVTPISIFDDLEGAVYRFSGTSPEDLAEGIQAFLGSIDKRDEDYTRIASKAEDWRHSHDYRAVSKRLYNICKALL
ncbi:glycosyltransferase [Novosphingobium sp. YAF33]|uniref:glycosyltransferase n=1 Tax=Novosphingobium sp. YAF33 TaxID=3233082 RepID=UPI003F977200